ncbi:MAG: putative rane protein [Actinomycetota bacterium]|nr:putative rane protein [Actinomycetota bacterium]
MKRPWIFAAGIAVLIVALAPPLHTVADDLFSVHMVQHLMLVLVAAPLLAWSAPAPARLPQLLRKPLVVGALHAMALWAWHLPVLYDAAIANPLLHIVEHGSFLVTAYLFWDVVIGKAGADDQLRRVGLVFATTLQSGALGAVIAFASSVLYTAHVASAPVRGLTPLEDQQLAGAIMWVPPGAVYVIVMLVLLWSAFKRYETAEQVQVMGER